MADPMVVLGGGGDDGQTEEATREYRRVLDLEPGHSAATQNLENLLGSPSAGGQ